MRLLAAVLVAVMIVLTTLAYGSPIDPSSPGFWDDGDFDDIILFLSCDLHYLDTEDGPPALAFETVSESVVELPAASVGQRTDESGSPRAPPVAAEFRLDSGRFDQRHNGVK